MSRIAILSDIHFGKFSRTLSFTVPGEQNQDKSKEAHSLEEELIQLFDKMRPQYFFVAGDLTSLGSPQEFHYCEDKIISIANRVGVKRENIICVMGNHDIDWNISKLGDIKKSKESELADLIKYKYQMIAANCPKINMNQLGAYYDQEGPAPFSGVIEQEEFILFMLNSGWHCTHDQKFPHGRLTQEQLLWFEKVARNYQADNRKKIILMHHHPFNYSYPIPGIDISTVEEGPEIMEIAINYGIDLIIHGHRHHPHVKTIQIGSDTKPITMICSGSLSVNHDHRNKGEIPNTVHFLDIDLNKDYYIVHNFRFTEASGWEPIEKYCKETPIDSVMKVGKTFSTDEIKIAIEKYANCDNLQLCLGDLDECLQFLPFKELNDKFLEFLKPTHDVVGEFPQNVILLKK